MVEDRLLDDSGVVLNPDEHQVLLVEGVANAENQGNSIAFIGLQETRLVLKVAPSLIVV